MYKKIEKTIIDVINEYKPNNIFDFWKEAIVKTISANNKLFNTLKQYVSDEHFMPNDILMDAKSVIVYFIPFTEQIIMSNMKGISASREWALAYIKTNDLITKINNELENLMWSNNFSVGKLPATHNFDEKTLMSNWSHRHIAYIAGLGTFGLNNMLITESGCCGRLGSIVTNYDFGDYAEIDERKEKCLHKITGGCGLCQKKCINAAYENQMFNRKKCYEKCLENAEYYKMIGHADACGKCLVGLPCSMQDPSKNIRALEF
ncbi:MAG: epoxyqueuosine reductase [Deltaproteobacteria bacterium]|jgi:epoxyqueuosine reductase QueG|nr:epoxyqueuosine reductase [Deltaproteobacteria bacterium]